MKNGRRSATERIELGEYIVADPEICHGKPTFKGTRIMIWQVLDALARGASSEEVVKTWGGRVLPPAIAESVEIARRSLLDKHGRLRTPAVSRASSRVSKTTRGNRALTALLRGGKINGRTGDWLRMTRGNA